MIPCILYCAQEIPDPTVVDLLAHVCVCVCMCVCGVSVCVHVGL